MSELRDKIRHLIENHHPTADWSRVDAELAFFEENELLAEVLSLYQTIQASPQRTGNENRRNCAVGFYLGLTTKPHDPKLPLDIPKRRTYGRAGFPDVDMDFDYERRHLIDEYLIAKYGAEFVAKIGTKQQLKTKAAVRRVIKVLDPDDNIVFDKTGKKLKDGQSENYQLEQKILSTLPGLMKRPDGTFVNSVKAAAEEYEPFRRYMEQYPEVYRFSRYLEGGISAFGCHAAGMVISPIPLERICPLHSTHDEESSEKTVATQFTMSDVESLGLIKFDVLGLSTKTAISEATKLIKERYNVIIDLANLPLNDKATLALLRSGKTDGCFQLENPGMKLTLQQIGVDCFDDLVVAVAMYRPGPKDYIPLFAKRKRGQERVVYPHPLLEKITKRTFGIICYQEQLMQAFMTLADLTASDGYAFMKGCAKKKQKEIDKAKKPFFAGASKKGMAQHALEHIWADFEKFGGYAFNKAHAVSYAYESFKTAYLKAHYPAEFFAARLSVENMRRNFDDVQKYEADATANFGMKLLPPDLNRSKMVYTIVGERELLRPITCKGIGDKAAEEIVQNQPYKGKDRLHDFAIKVGSAVNSKVIEAMCDMGLWPGLKKAQAVRSFELIKKDKQRNRGRPNLDMFD